VKTRTEQRSSHQEALLNYTRHNIKKKKKEKKEKKERKKQN